MQDFIDSISAFKSKIEPKFPPPETLYTKKFGFLNDSLNNLQLLKKPITTPLVQHNPELSTPKSPKMILPLTKSETGSVKGKLVRSRFGFHLIDSAHEIQIPEQVQSILTDFRISASSKGSKSAFQSPVIKPIECQLFGNLFDNTPTSKKRHDREFDDEYVITEGFRVKSYVNDPLYKVLFITISLIWMT